MSNHAPFTRNASVRQRTILKIERVLFDSLGDRCGIRIPARAKRAEEKECRIPARARDQFGAQHAQVNDIGLAASGDGRQFIDDGGRFNGTGPSFFNTFATFQNVRFEA